eukprot:gene3114-3409_t
MLPGSLAIFLTLFLVLQPTSSFQLPSRKIHFLHPITTTTTTTSASSSSSSSSIRQRPSALQPLRDGGLFDGLVEWVKYRETCPPEVCIEAAIAANLRQTFSQETLEWIHPLVAGTGILGLFGFGLFTGRRIEKFRAGNKKVTKENYLQYRQLHPKIMTVLLFFYLIELVSGLGTMLALEKPLLESPHFTTFLISFSCLLVQKISAGGIDGFPGRKFHSLFGKVTGVAIAAHVLTGAIVGWDLGMHVDILGLHIGA